MELLQESSNITALSTSRNLSSSSSAFVSAIQSPFFSPRSPQASKPEQNLLDIAGSSTGAVISRETLASVSGFKQSELISNLKNLASEVSPIPSFYTSSNFEVPTTTFRSSNIVSPDNGFCSSSNYSHDGNAGRREKQKRYGSSHGKHYFSWSPATISSAGRLRNCDVYIGFHGRKPSLLRFANWLRAEFELHGISCFASDRAHCRNSRSRDTVEKIMHASSFGVVIITKKCFGNSYSIEELKYFLDKKSLCPIFFDLSSCDCLARDIVEKRGELWEKYGGELWMLYGGLEKEWIEAVDGLSRTLEWQLEAYDGNWRACILQAVVLLATRLGRRSVVDRVNKWREKVEKEEFPFPRNEDFVGRNKELSELELILFGDVSGEGEREYFELKTRHRRKSMLVGRTINFQEDKNSICQLSESSSKGKEPVLWKESEKAIEMQRRSSPAAKFRPRRAKFGTRKRSIKIVYSKRIACVSGDSGIGKTELALEYAYRFSQRYKIVLWLGGESRYIRQNYLNLHSFLEVDLSIENIHLDKGKLKCFEKQEDEAITRIRKELMRDIPFLVVIDNLESEKDWWDRKVLMDFLPRFGGETHFIITTRLPQVINLEPLKLSYLSGSEALCLMKGGVKDYPVSEIDALRVLEEKLGRLTLGLGIVGAILSEIPITPTRLLDTINRMLSRDTGWNDRDSVTLRRHAFLVGLLDVCLSIFDHADGPRSLATRMVQISSFFAPSVVPVSLLALAAHKALEKHSGSLFWKNLLDKFTRSHIKKTETEASSMLVRFGVARCSTRPDCIHFHEIVKLYARKRGVDGVMLAMVRAVSLRGSIFHSSEHLWAACFLLFGFGTDRVFVELKPTELIQFIKRVALPLAVHTFITFSRCVAAMELLRLCTEALEVAAESLVSRAEKWFDKSFCCLNPIRSDTRYTHLWQELALLKATVLETRAKFMLKGGKYDMGDDLIRKAIFIRTSISGEHHPDTISARETLSKLTRLLANDQVSALCKERMHSLLSEELMRAPEHDKPVDAEDARWRSAVERCFVRMDQLALSACACGRVGEPLCRCDRSGIESEIVGSTAVIAVIGGGRLLVANCGDSRAVLSRGGRTVPLSIDHKPDRPDELARIEAAGGRVIYVNGARVQGILAMSRALGDKYLKPVVISTPEIVILEITPEDECLIIASDGLWDVIPNELACNVARRCLAEGGPKLAERGLNNQTSAGAGPSNNENDSVAPEAWCSMAAALLARLALGRRSTDNISVIVVDLRRC